MSAGIIANHSGGIGNKHDVAENLEFQLGSMVFSEEDIGFFQAPVDCVPVEGICFCAGWGLDASEVQEIIGSKGGFQECRAIITIPIDKSQLPVA